MIFPEPLNSLAPEHLRILEPYIRTVRFPKGTCIFEINSPGDGCYILDEGTVRLELTPQGSNPDDHEEVLGFLEPGTILGEMSLLDRLPRSATAYAHTDVVARRLDSQAIDNLAAAHPEVATAIFATLGRIASLKLRDITSRLAGFIFKKHDPAVDETVRRAHVAQQQFLTWPEDRIDHLLLALAQAVYAHAEELARLCVEETQIGNVPDKVIKIQVASLGVYHSLAGRIGYGLSSADKNGKVRDIAAPAGVVFGLIPVTNPVSTFIFKVLICLKGRNAVILSPSSRSVGVANRTGSIIQEVLKTFDAPPDIVQWVQKNNNRKTTVDFMENKGISLILATGGPSMVKAAYSSGTPAIGVGAGNAPVLICADADIPQAAQRIVASKTFDYGVVCCSEHNLVVNARVKKAFLEALEQEGAAVLTPEESDSFTAQVVDAQTNQFKLSIIGQSAAVIAEQTGIHRDYPIKLIVVPAERIHRDNVYAREKMAPVLSLFTVANEEEGFRSCQDILAIDGSGHTAIIYTQNPALSERFGLEMPASRILVNSPGVQGGVGLATGLTPSLTLGCGTFGGNSTTDNVTFKNLINIKRLAYYAPEQGALADLPPE